MFRENLKEGFSYHSIELFMTEALLEKILDEVKGINKRLDKLEWLTFDSKMDSVDPTPEDLRIINEYEREKDSIKFKKFV